LGEDGHIDYDQLRSLALEHKPKMIIAGASAYPRIIHFDKFADIAREVGAYLMVDMAHIAGLIAADCILPRAVCGRRDVPTHKRCAAPRAGRAYLQKRACRQNRQGHFPGHPGGPLDISRSEGYVLQRGA
jgi:glycine hydroxymethyltransferase